MRRDRYKCARCRREYTSFTLSVFSSARIEKRVWLTLIKLFDMEMTTLLASKEARVNYKTAYRVFEIIRKAVLYDKSEIRAAWNDWTDQLSKGADPDREDDELRSHPPTPVFGIRERDGIAKIEIAQDVSEETLIELAPTAARRGAIVYTKKHGAYDSLTYCGYRHIGVNRGNRSLGDVSVMYRLEGFWSFARERLGKYHGISEKNYPLYLSEMEWRYNNRLSKKRFEALTRLVLALPLVAIDG